MYKRILAADRVYLSSVSPRSTVGSYPTRFTLTHQQVQGGFVSVALSLESLPVVVNNCLALCCPDFPPHNGILRERVLGCGVIIQ